MLDLPPESHEPLVKDGRKCRGLERPRVERKVQFEIHPVGVLASKLMSSQHRGRAETRKL